MMPAADLGGEPLVHDGALFEELLALARRIDPEVRTGRMFGCPAIYWGRKMATCVYGTDVGMRVPRQVAVENIASGRATSFQPYGKPAMKEWIKLEGGAAALDAGRDLIANAIAFAEANNA